MRLISRKKHRALLRKCGLPVSLADVYPVSRERLEKLYPHLKMSEDEKAVRRIVNNVADAVINGEITEDESVIALQDEHCLIEREDK